MIAQAVCLRAQYLIRTSAVTSAGGRAQTTPYAVVAAVGQPIQFAFAQAGDFAFYGGFIQPPTTVAPHTPHATTTSPTNIDTTRSTITALVVPNSQQTIVRFEYGRTSAYGDTVSPTQNHISGYSAVEVNATLSNLLVCTRYYYRVVATNERGITRGDSMTFMTLPRAPTASSGTRVDSAGFVAHWNPDQGVERYALDVAFDSAFSSFVQGYDDRDVGNVTQFSVGGLQPQSEYFYRVRALNADGGISRNSNIIGVITTRFYPAAITIAKTFLFPSYEQLTEEFYVSSDYQLIGLPGNSGQLISSFLEQNGDGVSWVVYRDNGRSPINPKDYYERFDGSSNFNASTGRAFWVLHRNDWVIADRTVPTAPLDTNGEVSIELSAGRGYYLITNPFEVPVLWQDVARHNGIVDSIRTWDFTNWSRVSEMYPYEGYLFFNGQNHTKIRFPWHLTSSAASRPLVQQLDSLNWTIDVVVTSGRFADKTTSLGVSPEAAPGVDLTEQHKPRRFDHIPDIVFEKPEWDEEYPDFATDFRPSCSSLETWNLVLRTGIRGPVNIEFNNVGNVPQNFAVFLLDSARARATDLRTQSSYQVIPIADRMFFQIVVGTPARVREKINSIMPTKFSLFQNYPNPFNASTIIPIEVPIAGPVEIQIYNLVGQRVKTLARESVDPGRYFYNWDGANDGSQKVASGVYFYRLSTNNAGSFVRKMILLK